VSKESRTAYLKKPRRNQHIRTKFRPHASLAQLYDQFHELLESWVIALKYGPDGARQLATGSPSVAYQNCLRNLRPLWTQLGTKNRGIREACDWSPYELTYWINRCFFWYEPEEILHELLLVTWKHYPYIKYVEGHRKGWMYLSLRFAHYGERVVVPEYRRIVALSSITQKTVDSFQRRLLNRPGILPLPENSNDFWERCKRLVKKPCEPLILES